MMIATLVLLTPSAAVLFALLANLPWCFRAILNDARIISKDPALQTQLEILYAYPGFWALFWYRLSHALLELRVPLVSTMLPRLVMTLVRYATAIEIHPQARISPEGILIDHGTGVVIGATAVVGGGVTLYHGVTLGGTGKPVPVGAKRHPTVGDNVVIGAGAKILGDIEIGENVLVGANSVVTKSVPANHTAVGIPARVLCRGSGVGKDVTGAAICELHRRLRDVERQSEKATSPVTAVVVADMDNSAGGTIEGLAPSTPKRSRALTMPLTPIQPRTRLRSPSGLSEGPKQHASEVGEFWGPRPPVVNVRGGSPRLINDAEGPRGAVRLDGVGEVLYGMEALGQKAFGVAAIMS